ncbi:MAG TPA: hybrid sensor histidine kinase/response regulator [Verrucomicrobiae bacterium]|nr:hybrid sensor histidine kinase/response regulator [Verrucomicrobiae bacterium]
MKTPDPDDLSNLSMLELFQVEADSQIAVLIGGLLQLEREPDARPQLEVLMRAAHSFKGAARIVNQDAAVVVAHAMEDCFVAAQLGRIKLRQDEIDVLFQGVDLLLHISRRSGAEMAQWEAENAARIQGFLASLNKITRAEVRAPEPAVAGEVSAASAPTTALTEAASKPVKPEPPLLPARKKEGSERMLRLTAENLNRLLGLAGESLVESRWLHPFADSMLRLKRMQSEVMESLHGLRDSLQSSQVSERADDQMKSAIEKLMECREFLSERMADLDVYDRRSSNLSNRLYLEVLQCRMRPFEDGVRRLPRMVRDLARSLGKQVRLEIAGEHTQVDRDILEKLETPLTHLLRNAVDHGCEPAADRERAGKNTECTIRVEARHSAGMLMIVVTDDGPGIEPERLRETIVQKKLINRNVVEKMSETELLEFLLLPGFTMRDTVTEISGRGVGLDVVQNMVKSVRGSVRIANQPGKGMRFQLQLPLTLSVLRTLLVEVGDEPYAIPLSQISRTMKLPREKVEVLEGRHHFSLDGRQVGLLSAHQVLDCGEPRDLGGELPVVIMGDRMARYGMVVDRFLGERELVVQTLDSRLGKVRDISAGSLMEDGSPVLIVDVEDMLVSIEKLVSSGRLNKVHSNAGQLPAKPGKRVLVVDDSLTVRELQRKLLAARGYAAEVAVDGMDGWNAVQSGNYDLVITDVDMPRVDGIELATLIKRDPRFASLPVVIVSYKDREEDRLRGLEAGADYYLTKGGFHDETLVQAVVDLIGEADR